MARFAALSDRVQSWSENKRDIDEREERGERIDSSEWDWSDDEAIDIVYELAAVLGR